MNNPLCLPSRLKTVPACCSRPFGDGWDCTRGYPLTIRIGDKIDFCSCGDGKVREVRLSRDKLAYIVHCKCNSIHYVSFGGKKV
jgi:hypothetical protein